MLGRGRAQKKDVLLFLEVADHLWLCFSSQPASSSDFWFFSWSGQHQKLDAYVETTSWKWNPLGLLSSKIVLISVHLRQQPHLQGGLEYSFYSLITQQALLASVDPGNGLKKPDTHPRNLETPQEQDPCYVSLGSPVVAYLNNWWLKRWRNSL